jgi:cell fate (sporulation/competence/biofilm development) regulator YlbF (YheA/YmcA/DUF963 family)
MDSEATALLDAANALTVKVSADRQKAADLWDAIRAFRKQEEANKETTCRPLKTAWDEAKVPFDEFIKKCEAAEKKMQAAMSTWDREQDRLAREAQAKIQAKIDAENAKKIAKAEEKGKDLSEVVLKVAPVVQAPAKSIETQAGTTQTRITKKVYKPKDLKSLMAAFPDLFELSVPKFNALAKTGMLDGRADVDITEEYIYTQRG